MDRVGRRGVGNPFEKCMLCPRLCGADRTAGPWGYCRSGSGINVARVVAHHGEEPVISGSQGICNVFFAHCNMQCTYCQNYQISRNETQAVESDLEDVVDQIIGFLKNGVTAVGFVSPSHCISQMKQIIVDIERHGWKPVYVFNTNSYDRKETIESLEGLIDVYLPDLKYMNESISVEYSDAPGYPGIAADCIVEMYRQKGPDINLDERGNITSGLIIRHLILPGQVENSKSCLRFIAEELSPSVHVSLMTQYWPIPAVADHPLLGRTISQEEYDAVMEEFERLGLWRGWTQDLTSPLCYRPDFTRPDVFG